MILREQARDERIGPTVLTIAASRAVWSNPRPRWSAVSRTTRLYCRTTFADQNLAIAVCSLVRALPLASPYNLIWLNASTRSLL
jgi:hypothetical protein